MKNLSQSISNYSKTKPNHPALINDETVITYAQLDNLIDNICFLFDAKGIEKGDLVAICLPDNIEHIVVFYSLIRIGAAILPKPMPRVSAICDVTLSKSPRVQITFCNCGVNPFSIASPASSRLNRASELI